MRKTSYALIVVAIGALAAGGCPMTPSSATGGMTPGTYIGSGTSIITSTTSDPITTSGDMSIQILADGRVLIGNAEYSVGQIVRETDGTTYTRLDSVTNTSYASDSILIYFDTSISLQVGLTFSGTGTITLRRIDDRTIDYREQLFTSNTSTGTTLNMQQESSATLHR